MVIDAAIAGYQNKDEIYNNVIQFLKDEVLSKTCEDILAGDVSWSVFSHVLFQINIVHVHCGIYGPVRVCNCFTTSLKHDVHLGIHSAGRVQRIAEKMR